MTVFTMKFTEIPDCPISLEIMNGRATVHGRKASDRNQRIKDGDRMLLEVYQMDSNQLQYILDLTVTEVNTYGDLAEFVGAVGLDKILGDRTKCINVKTESEYVDYLSKFVDTEEIKQYKTQKGFGMIGYTVKFNRRYNVIRTSIDDSIYDMLSVKTDEDSTHKFCMINKDWVDSLAEYDRIVFTKQSGNSVKHINLLVVKTTDYDNLEELAQKMDLTQLAIYSGVESEQNVLDLLVERLDRSAVAKYGIKVIEVQHV